MITIATSSPYAANISALIRRTNANLVSPEELQLLRAAQAEYEKIYALILATGCGAAKAKLAAIEKNVHDNPSAANAQQYVETASTLSEIQKRDKQIRRTLNAALRELCKKQVFPIIKTILLRAADYAYEQEVEIGNQELANAKIAGVPFARSQTLQAIRQSVAQLRDYVSKLGMVIVLPGSPQTMLHGILDIATGEVCSVSNASTGESLGSDQTPSAAPSAPADEENADGSLSEDEQAEVSTDK